ncbi:MAG: M23 family metallopeptidase [Alphaproteobacteria bacterium]|nr:M23 family metallopeptidase [Alphaproteobacteria bacterium]
MRLRWFCLILLLLASPAAGEERKVLRADGRIAGTLNDSFGAAGIPPEVGREIVTALSWDMDLQREITGGDRFVVLFERFSDDRPGHLLYLDFLTLKRHLTLYRHTPHRGQTEFFTATGRSAQKDLLRTPVDGARLSSTFGPRHHPVLGYGRQHQGVDFAAPSGTPVYAAGYGLVEVAGSRGGYGNFIRIYHHHGYATAYGHLSRLGDGIKPGMRVRQGQVIGYVGSTGLSSGPHLHYEVRRDGVAVDPLAVARPATVELEGDDLRRFKQAVDVYDRTVATMPLAVAERRP